MYENIPGVVTSFFKYSSSSVVRKKVTISICPAFFFRFSIFVESSCLFLVCFWLDTQSCTIGFSDQQSFIYCTILLPLLLQEKKSRNHHLQISTLIMKNKKKLTCPF